MAEKRAVKKSSSSAKKQTASGSKKATRTRTTTTAATKKAVKKPLKDPAGGLTAAGRAAFAAKDGSHLRPGVTGPADTPEKMKRKGSFLRRHFANPRGPMQKDGEPTRLALSAHAWGEPVPKTSADAKKLAGKGKTLLGSYQKKKAQSKSS